MAVAHRLDDFLAVAVAVLADPGVRRGAVILVDGTAADPSAMTGKDLWRTAAGIAPLLTREVRRIVIAASSDVAYGLGRAFEVSGAAMGFEVRTCRSMEEARRWLAQQQHRTP